MRASISICGVTVSIGKSGIATSVPVAPGVRIRNNMNGSKTVSYRVGSLTLRQNIPKAGKKNTK